MRMLEIEHNSKSYIKIDGVDTKEVGLHHVRRAITLIPQDPFLMQGTLKSNIDPWGKYSDDEIITVLKKTNIYKAISQSISEFIKL